MKAIRLHGPHDLRLGNYDEPPPPSVGEVVIAVGSVGICGSDLHLFEHGRIGTTVGEAPFVPGHEFMGAVIAAGCEARDGFGRLLVPGMRVAVDPQVPCLRCEWCAGGNPNLCPHHTFFGLYPTDGALRERMLVPARNCFPLPDTIGDDAAAVLETLGVALHATDLAKIRVGRSCAVLGCGAVGLLIVRLAHLAGVHPLIAIDPLPWRTALARRWGATHAITARAEDALAEAGEAAGGRGCDVVFEAGWVGAAGQAAVDLATPGGKVVLVGIPGDDSLTLTHSVARRKGLTLLFSRRMKHVYPRAIALASGPEPRVDVDALVTHRFPLAEAAAAFELSAGYRDGVIKAVVQPAAG
jgi:L-iditol 2-dehydrogenase